MNWSTEAPMALLSNLAGTMGDIADRRDRVAIQNHREEDHIPPKRTDPLKAIPFPKDLITDVQLAQMVEVLTTEHCTVEEVAGRFNFPIPLVERQLAEYKSRWRAFILKRTI